MIQTHGNGLNMGVSLGCRMLNASGPNPNATGGSEVTSQQESIICVCGSPSCQIPFGFCHCDCGRTTEIAKYSSRREKCQKGLPRKFRNGHGRRNKRIDFSNARPFKIEGFYCKLIDLGKDLFTIVLETDFGWLSKLTWNAKWDKSSKAFYAARNSDKGPVLMHREILKDVPVAGMRRDHINGVSLDNRRQNLRLATPPRKFMEPEN